MITGYYNFTTFIDEEKCISEVFKHMFTDIHRHLKLFAEDVLLIFVSLKFETYN